MEKTVRARIALVAAGAIAIVVTATAAAQPGGAIKPAARITPPAGIQSAGKIVYCTDATYPPEESFQGSKIVGSDIDIGTGVGKLMGVGAEFKNTGFDGIIAALLSKRCDAVISGMNDTPARRKQVDFVDYLKVGQSIMVKKGNPNHISSLASLAGHTVSVESGTTNRDFLAASSKALVAKGKKAISIKTFPKDTDAFAALKAGRVDAYFADAPPVAYYAKTDSSVQVAGTPVNPIPIGIAIRKGDPLRGATAKAIALMTRSGAMKKILAKWGMTQAAVLLKK
jgi:polar amino acid transport system substrate-binding protein